MQEFQELAEDCRHNFLGGAEHKDWESQ